MVILKEAGTKTHPVHVRARNKNIKTCVSYNLICEVLGKLRFFFSFFPLRGVLFRPIFVRMFLCTIFFDPDQPVHLITAFFASL